MPGLPPSLHEAYDRRRRLGYNAAYGLYRGDRPVHVAWLIDADLDRRGGVRNVKAGLIAATAQQYPLKMAALGVEAAVEYAKSGKKASGTIDTGVTLITDKPMKAVDSKDTTFGMDGCWGK